MIEPARAANGREPLASPAGDERCRHDRHRADGVPCRDITGECGRRCHATARRANGSSRGPDPALWAVRAAGPGLADQCRPIGGSPALRLAASRHGKRPWQSGGGAAVSGWRNLPGALGWRPDQRRRRELRHGRRSDDRTPCDADIGQCRCRGWAFLSWVLNSAFRNVPIRRVARIIEAQDRCSGCHLALRGARRRSNDGGGRRDSRSNDSGYWRRAHNLSS